MDCVVLVDFDGTITTEDTLDYIVDRLFGVPTRKQWETELIHGSLGYQEYLDKFHKICFDIDQFPPHMVDPYFRCFYETHRENTYIVSKGMHNIVCGLLPYVDTSHIQAHKIEIDPHHVWHVDKDLEIIDKREIVSEWKKTCPFLVFIGDGITDFEVVDRVDLLFVKRGSHLHQFILQQPPPPPTVWVLFDTFADILRYMRCNRAL